jgi:hypothetical protein
MKRTRVPISGLLLILSFCFVTHSGALTYKTTFVPLATGVPGLLLEPVTPGPMAEIGIVALHMRADYLTPSSSNPCPELAKRGYRALCANTSTSKSGFIADDDEDKMLLSIKLAVAYMRSYPGVKKVVLYGHSGGGALMSAYQNIAENGVKACQGQEKILKCPDTLVGLPPADGVVLIDSTFGEGGMSMFHLDPSITDEEKGKSINPDLDMYSPKNGFDPKGSTYSDAFKTRYFGNGRDRMNRLIAKAQERLAKINAGEGNFSDDEPFVIPGYSTPGNKLFTTDRSLWAHTRNPWPLLHPDGTVTTEIVYSVRVPRGTESPSTSLSHGAMTTSARRFLSTLAIRPTENFGYDASGIHGIDWNSEYENTVNGVEGVTVPLLQMGMTGSYEYFAAETIREHAKSADKTLAYVEGAVHTFTPCKECAVAKGLPENYYGDTVKRLFDYIGVWLAKPGRFLSDAEQ